MLMIPLWTDKAYPTTLIPPSPQNNLARLFPRDKGGGHQS